MSIIPHSLLFIIMPVGMLMVIFILLRSVPALWQLTVGAEDNRRNHTMDGVRGLLSLWVLTHHLLVISTPAALPLKPLAPSGAVEMLMGSSFFTAPFYALTGMLFGGALLVSGGKLNTWQFLRRRLFRLLPVYILSIGMVIFFAFYMTSFKLNISLFKMAKEIGRWSSFGFLKMYDINSAPVASWHGMLWTLPFEICFYLALPVFAFAQRKLRTPAILVIGLLAMGAFNWQFLFFATGVVAAAALSWRHRWNSVVWTVLSIAALFGLGLTASLRSPALQAVLLIPILVAAAKQIRLFFLFRGKPIRFIGEISYSIYILHFPILSITFDIFINREHFSSLEMPVRLALLCVIGVMIICLSATSYVFVERPLIALSRRGRS
ncbi:MAG: acyltransferase, partial [Cytophagaceae bacterium]